MSSAMDIAAKSIGASTAEVFGLFSGGLSPSEIARKLGMDERDVRSAVVSVWRAYDEGAAAKRADAKAGR